MPRSEETAALLPRRMGDYIARATTPLALSRPGGDTELCVVNAAFCKLTGYSRDEVLGRNCRFLQGERRAQSARRRMRAFIDDPQAPSGRFLVSNFNKDGAEFDNLVFLTRLRNRLGETQLILASQFDMSRAGASSRLHVSDLELARDLSELGDIGAGHGLALVETAQTINDSVALLARLALRET